MAKPRPGTFEVSAFPTCWVTLPLSHSMRERHTMWWPVAPPQAEHMRSAWWAGHATLTGQRCLLLPPEWCSWRGMHGQPVVAQESGKLPNDYKIYFDKLFVPCHTHTHTHQHLGASTSFFEEFPKYSNHSSCKQHLLFNKALTHQATCNMEQWE